MSKNLVRSAKSEYMPVRVRVTDRDLNKADKDLENNLNRSNYCPIARSLKRVVVKGTTVHVGGDHVTFTKNGKMYRKALNETAKDFVFKFDNGYCHNPIRTTLRLPKTVLKRCNG